MMADVEGVIRPEISAELLLGACNTITDFSGEIVKHTVDGVLNTSVPGTEVVVTTAVSDFAVPETTDAAIISAIATEGAESAARRLNRTKMNLFRFMDSLSRIRILGGAVGAVIINNSIPLILNNEGQDNTSGGWFMMAGGAFIGVISVLPSSERLFRPQVEDVVDSSQRSLLMNLAAQENAVFEPTSQQQEIEN